MTIQKNRKIHLVGDRKEIAQVFKMNKHFMDLMRR